MMPRFGTVPDEVPVERSLTICAPAFCSAVQAMLATLSGGREEWAFETIRTEARQAYLYGFGRDYDDGRGRVTNASTALNSWHGFGLAVDIVEKDATPWDAPVSFWNEIGDAAAAHGLTWGGRWARPDLPHVQWGRCPVSPTESDRTLFKTKGVEAVWRKYGAHDTASETLPTPPRVVWSPTLRDYLVVTRFASDDDWSFVRLSDLTRQPAIRGAVKLSTMPTKAT